MQRWVGLSVIADNVIEIGSCLVVQGAVNRTTSRLL